jgi:hypothetical protein
MVDFQLALRAINIFKSKKGSPCGGPFLLRLKKLIGTGVFL